MIHKTTVDLSVQIIHLFKRINDEIKEKWWKAILLYPQRGAHHLMELKQKNKSKARKSHLSYLALHCNSKFDHSVSKDKRKNGAKERNIKSRNI